MVASAAERLPLEQPSTANGGVAGAGIVAVTARWLTDSAKFNEYMKPGDYAAPVGGGGGSAAAPDVTAFLAEIDTPANTSCVAVSDCGGGSSSRGLSPAGGGGKRKRGEDGESDTEASDSEPNGKREKLPAKSVKVPPQPKLLAPLHNPEAEPKFERVEACESKTVRKGHRSDISESDGP
jgi:hypothetical protein